MGNSSTSDHEKRLIVVSSGTVAMWDVDVLLYGILLGNSAFPKLEVWHLIIANFGLLFLIMAILILSPDNV